MIKLLVLPILLILVALGLLAYSPDLLAYSDGPFVEHAKAIQVVKIRVTFEKKSTPSKHENVIYCSGTVLKNVFVLSDSHCFDFPVQKIQVVADNGQSEFGIVKSLRLVTTGDHKIVNQRFSTEGIYASFANPGDFAIFKLASPLKIPQTAHPFRLPLSAEEVRLALERNDCVGYGYGPQTRDLEGAASLGSMDAQFDMLNLQAFPVKARPDFQHDTFKLFFLDSVVRIPGRITHGDSGGPLVCEIATGENIIVANAREIIPLNLGSVARPSMVQVDMFEVLSPWLEWLRVQFKDLAPL